MITEEHKEVRVKYLKVTQPLGDFYIVSMDSKTLVDISYFDVRRVLMEDRDIEKYLGIQRPLSPHRVKEIGIYVNTKDACFPTGVIVAIQDRCVKVDEDRNELIISNFIDPDSPDENILYRNIARVIDGQHRLAGLAEFTGETFSVNVSIFIGTDIADQATIFSKVNLAQTKVSKSLTYDLFELMKSRSPQKLCHNIAVTLDREKTSPFYKMIKRLGVATPGRSNETLSQATFIEPLLRFVSANPMLDRDAYLKGKKPKKINIGELSKHPFQHLFVDENDFIITDIVWDYFDAVRQRWPNAWRSRDKGMMLNKTNGYRALMRLLRSIYIKSNNYTQAINKEDFLKILSKSSLEDEDFNVSRFAPGSSGESELFRILYADCDLAIGPKQQRLFGY